MCTTAGTLKYHVRIYIQLQMMNSIRRSDPPRHQPKKFEFCYAVLYHTLVKYSRCDKVSRNLMMRYKFHPTKIPCKYLSFVKPFCLNNP